MKRVICLLLCLLTVLALCACGSGNESKKPADMQSSLPTTTASEEEAAESEQPVSDEAAAIQEAVQKALKLKNRPVSELYDAIGEPESEDAAPSCMGPGEDVNLYYDGFTVYTYKEGNEQTVVDAEINP